MNILITGARSGIACDLIEKIVKNNKCKNYNVYASTKTIEQKEALEDAMNKYDNVSCIKLDITNEKDINNINNMDIDILICNADICVGGSILDVPIDKIKENYEVNVFSTIRLIQVVARKMIEKNIAKIIVIGSLAGLVPFNFIGVYASTKSAIYMITRILSNEIKLLTDKVHVILIEPGLYHTGFNQIMIEDNYNYLDNSVFKDKLNKFVVKEKLIFDLLEKNDTSSITNKIMEAIISNKPKFIYRAPITQVASAKIYNLFKS